MVAFLVSDLATYLSGAEIAVDGGLFAGGGMNGVLQAAKTRVGKTPRLRTEDEGNT